MDTTTRPEEAPAGSSPGGLDRRTLLTRGAAAGAILAWSVPAMTSMAAAAGAGSAPCACFFCAQTPFGLLRCEPVDPADCNCICNCAAGASVAPCTRTNPCQVQLRCMPVDECLIS